MNPNDQAARRLAAAALKTADALDGHPDYADRAEGFRAAAADLTRPLTREQRREVTAITALLLSGPVALALAVLALALVLAACGAGTPTAQTSGPDPTPAQTCREAAREAFTGLVRDDPTITQHDAQALIDDACAAVAPTDRQTIIDSERTAALARWQNTEG